LEVIKVKTDVTNESEVAVLFDSIQGHPIDILVNNAGSLEQVAPLAESDPTLWWQTWEGNIKGTYLPTHQFLRRFETGTIINTSSRGSIYTAPGMSSYQASKTAVNRFTDFIHTEYPTIRAFAYHPGGVLTELASLVKQHYPLSDAPELAGYCVWLATEKADFLRGRYSDCTWDVDNLMGNSVVIIEKDLLKERVAME
jgi:NAD(P)-dependent dehydrogenase (short-subunit alcohol dehydrogenase family)